MSIKDTAKSLFGDLLSDKEKEELGATVDEPTEPDTQYIVYFLGDKPDTVWEYHHKPDDGSFAGYAGIALPGDQNGYCSRRRANPGS